MCCPALWCLSASFTGGNSGSSNQTVGLPESSANLDAHPLTLARWYLCGQRPGRYPVLHHVCRCGDHDQRVQPRRSPRRIVDLSMDRPGNDTPIHLRLGGLEASTACSCSALIVADSGKLQHIRPRLLRAVVPFAPSRRTNAHGHGRRSMDCGRPEHGSSDRANRSAHLCVSVCKVQARKTTALICRMKGATILALYSSLAFGHAIDAASELSGLLTGAAASSGDLSPTELAPARRIFENLVSVLRAPRCLLRLNLLREGAKSESATHRRSRVASLCVLALGGESA